MEHVLPITLIIFGILYLSCLLYHIIYSTCEKRELKELNLYEVFLLFPSCLVLCLIGFGKLLIKTDYVQAFHKFMLKKPSDLINFRITIEKRS